tara:strand:- start:80 stop:856 length:777 start_codon:yes stop_codon:yes gene_type:complete
MSKLNDLPIGTTASASEVHSNDTKVKNYIAKINHRDKVSPYHTWTESYFVPALSPILGFPPSGPTNQYLISGFYNRFPVIKGKVTEAHGRRFLGGNIHVTKSFGGIGHVTDVDSSGAFPVLNLVQTPASDDLMVVSMYRSSVAGDSSLLPLTSGGNLINAPYADEDGNFSQKMLQEKASKVDDQSIREWLVRPRVCFNSEGGSTGANLTIELPADSQYIGANEYWYLEFEGIGADGQKNNHGWQGVTINLRFAALLES